VSQGSEYVGDAYAKEQIKILEIKLAETLVVPTSPKVSARKLKSPEIN
jgi:hypothetical protein